MPVAKYDSKCNCCGDMIAKGEQISFYKIQQPTFHNAIQSSKPRYLVVHKDSSICKARCEEIGKEYNPRCHM